jgi:hypothetical protein
MNKLLVACGFLFALGFTLTVEGRNVRIPLNPTSATAKYIWFPKDDGSGRLVPAFLEGSEDILADERDIHFWLFTKDNPTTGQELFLDDPEGIRDSHFDSNAPVKIISHGFGSGSFLGGSSGTIKNAYTSILPSGNINIVMIEWSKLSADPWYDKAAANTRMVGAKTARFIEFLVDYRFTTLSKIHIIGHSLGAHVAGFAGAGLLVGRLPRITASDPALPLFGDISDEGRIDKSDALFVDVIHTSGGFLWEGGLAFIEPRGHVDFYPNGGRKQPGCTGLPEIVGACSHARSYEYFSESVVNNNAFTGCKCSSFETFNDCNCAQTVKMGDKTPTSASGYYHVETNSVEPYGQG